jgi:Zn-dependent protease
MRDVTSWSVSCGRSTDVELRLHVSLLIAAAAVLHCGLRAGGGENAAVAIMALGIYVAALAAHELAHAVSAWKWGGRIECVVVGPVGGLVHHGPQLEPRGDLVVSLSGPAVNLAIAGVAIVTLTAAGRPVGPVFFPFAPPSESLNFSVVGAITLAAWINWLLALVNLLPTFPLDGARIIAALMRRRLDDQPAVARAAQLGVATAIACLVAWYFVPGEHDAAAFVLAVLGIVGLFQSSYEMQRSDNEAEFGDALRYDPGLSLEAEERRPHVERLGPLRSWWRRRQDAKLLERLRTEREEEERADEVLARLHDHGLASLSPQDRALLQRVSARYRQRH